MARLKDVWEFLAYKPVWIYQYDSMGCYFWRRRIRSRENKWSKSLATGSPARIITTRLSSIHTMEFDDKPRFFGSLSTDLALYTGILSLTTSLVHGVFISRVFRLEKSLYGKRRISFVLIAFCVMEQGAACRPVNDFSNTGNSVKISSHNYQVMIVWSTSISLGCSAINDVLIAGTLVYILYKHRTTSPRTNQMIMKLIIFCSQTGLITTASSRALTMSLTKMQWAACRFDMYHLFMCFPIGGLYATCLLANFIARESYLQPQTVHERENSEISFGPFTQVIHVGLPDNNSGQQETLAMQEGTHSSKASSC
ncbi:hypothetical protein BDR06DRAFT_956667 [Suillus hirtellus]|nr:hypothetical protein BDR06DRAFT_956667 [Suillus hirtellus]